jgi:hypothetical protein
MGICCPEMLIALIERYWDHMLAANDSGIGSDASRVFAATERELHDAIICHVRSQDCEGVAVKNRLYQAINGRVRSACFDRLS